MIAESSLFEALEAPAKQIGYDLISVKTNKGKDGWTLSIVVDKPEPISLDDIVNVSDALGKVLDEIDPIEEGYMLDVSSLGAEKPIPVDKLHLYVNRYVNLHLSHPVNGENILEGTLLGIEDGNVNLQIAIKAKKKTLVFPLGQVDRARLAIKF